MKMKKFVSLVLSASMVLSSAGYALAEAPKDVDGTKYEESVTRLAALDVLKGYEDGTFKPGKTITRAEFAKIMANVVGVGSAAEYAKGQTKFNDVPASHWAAGYINVVSDLEVINGYGDGNFGPNDQVTYAQAITMIVRALGYKPMADAKGGYPGGYLAVAAEKDITDDVNVVSTLAATRGDVALMVDNSLDVGLMEQKTYGQYPEYEETDETLITKKLDVEELNGVIVNIPETQSALDDNEIEINVDTNDDGKWDKIETVEVLTDANLMTLLGVEVTVWANDDDEVFFIDQETDEDDIKFDTIDANDTTKEEITLLVEDDDFEWADDATVFINFEEEDTDDVEKDMYGYVVLNDKGDVEFANLLDFEALSELITEVDGDELDVESASNVDLEDYEDGVYLYDKNLNKIEQDKIAEDSVISYYTDDEEIWMVVVNDTETGTLEQASDDELTLAGEDYDIRDMYYSLDNKEDIEDYTKDNKGAENIEDLMDEEVKVIFDINKNAKFIYGDVKETGGVMFGLLVKADNTGLDTRIKILNSNDEELIYKFEDDDDFTANASELTDAKKNNLVAFELNKDGEIAEDKFAAGLVNIEKEFGDDFEKVNVSSYDVDDDGYLEAGSTRYYVEDDTVFFNVEADGDAEVVAFKDFEDVDDKVKTISVLKDEKGNDLVAVVLNDISTVNTDYLFGVVTKEPNYKSAGWEVGVKTYDETASTFIIADLDDTPKSDFKEGNIISFKINADDEITKTIVNKTVVTIKETEDKDILIGSKWYKIANDAVLYALDDDKEIEKSINYKVLDENDKVSFLLDEDNDKISALILFDEDTVVKPGDPNENAKGLVTYINATAGEEAFAVNGDLINLTSAFILKDSDGNILLSGSQILSGTKKLEVGDKVEVTGKVIKRINTATEILELAVKAELNKLSDSYELANADTGKTATEKATLVKALVENQVDSAVVTVAVSDALVVELTHKDVTSVTDTKTVAVTFANASTVATLSSLRIGGQTVNGFATSENEYTIELAKGTTGAAPVATAVTTDTNATLVVANATAVETAGSNASTVTVTAEDGTTKVIYTITFTIAN